jgi:branched-chain amino acid transport system substrate-binding protein
MRLRNRAIAALALTLLIAVAVPVSGPAAPSGPPVRVGSSLALTGPLAATALVHKITGEIYVEQLNRKNGLLGRPVEWVLLDDQSKPDVARTLYERLVTVDKVDLLIGPYATGAILSAMGVAQR